MTKKSINIIIPAYKANTTDYALQLLNFKYKKATPIPINDTYIYTIYYEEPLTQYLLGRILATRK